jgi:hypothetical protein
VCTFVYCALLIVVLFSAMCVDCVK